LDHDPRLGPRGTEPASTLRFARVCELPGNRCNARLPN
jgi:hypothetical protein